MNPVPSPVPEIRKTRLLLAVVDLAGFVALVREREDSEIATLLHEFYGLVDRCLGSAGAEVLKTMGDGCLAVAPPERTEAVVASLPLLVRDVQELGRSFGAPLEVGANVHLGEVVRGSLGPASLARDDVFGQVVNQTFLMGTGRGIRLSEAVYRELPTARRRAWRRERPVPCYHWRG